LIGGLKQWNIIEAIMARHSVRDFISKPVPKKTLMKILEVALRAHQPATLSHGKYSLPPGELLRESVRHGKNLSGAEYLQELGALQPPAEVVKRRVATS